MNETPTTNGHGNGNGTTPALSPQNLQVLELTRKDFVSDQEVRWCPGCGDYSILAQTQKTMPDFGVPKENIVFVSGIGCSGRLPYYMNTYGFHSIHGRAPTLATGLKLANPELMVWVITGDGDALSIGGNHILHSMRRNVDIKVVMFNNRIYGLTKGQASPTSELGKKTKSSPLGTVDTPIQPLSIALAAEASFVARSVDTHTEHLQETLNRAGLHHGSVFDEVLQNCNIFNDGAYREFTERDVRDDRMLVLEHGKPMIFGKDRDKGIRLNGLHPEVVTIGENGVTEADLLVHDETAADPYLAYMLSRMWWPDYPVPVGVLRRIERPTHDQLMVGQIQDAITRQGAGRHQQAARQRRDLDGPGLARVAAVICPQCGFDNIQGVDECANCGFDLMSVDIPSPSTGFEAELVNIPLADLVHHKPLTIAPGASAADAVRQMQQAGAGCLIVADGDKVRGILSERDLVMKLDGASLEGITVEQLMTPDPVVLRPDDSIAVAINKMAVGGFRHIPLVVDGRATGIVSARDVFRHILSSAK